MKCVLFFLFLIFLNLIGFSSLDEFSCFAHPSQLEWSFMESHISCVFWWINILSQLDKNSCIHFSLSLFLLVEIFSSLMAYSFSHSLIPPQNLISPWWALFSELDESSYFELVILLSLSPLRALPSSVESIRSSLPYLEI